MTRFADPTRCPDCGTPLAPGSALCAGCGIDLSGPLGRELYSTLVHADTLLGRLRAAARQPVGSGAVAAPPAPTGAAPAPGTGLPPMPPLPTSPRDAMRPSRAPQLLLGLGAFCLVVAAVVFLAVTWSRLGVGGRTAVLVLLTAAAGAVTAWSLRRGLRATAESFGAVAGALLVLDLVGARSSGWLGSPDDAAFVAAVGAVLAALGLAAAAAAARTEAVRLVVAESFAVLGAALVAGGVAASSFGTAEGRLLVAVLVSAGVTGVTAALHRRTSLLVALAGTALVAAGTWCLLVLAGLDHLGSAPSFASVVGDADGWPLVAASVLAAAVAVFRPLPVEGRVLAGAASVVVLTLAVTAPVLDEPATPATLVAVAVLLGAGVVALLAPRPWGAVGLGSASLAALVTVFQALVLTGAAATSVADTALPVWRGTPGGSTAAPDLTRLDGDLGSPWLLPVTLVALAATAWAFSTLLPSRLQPRTGAVAAGVALGIGVTGALVLAELPVALPLALLLAAACAATGTAVAGPDRYQGGLVLPLGAAVALLAALPLALHDELLTLAACVVATAVAAVLHLLHRRAPVAVVAGSAFPPVVGALVWTAGALAGPPAGTTALVGIVVVALVALGHGFLPVMHQRERTGALAAGIESAALASAAVLAAAGLDAENGSLDWTAGYLTAGGVAASLLALLRPDRRRVGWLGGALLAAATWARLGAMDVEVVEAYTLPSGIALLVVGALRVRRDPEVSTLRALSAGLGVSLVPSLLLAVDEPVSLRALLLGLACLVLVVGGAVGRWAAPMVHGTAVGLLLVAYEAAPYLGSAVPRWAVIGGAGALLITLGMTWEQRLRDARAVAGYVRGLR